MNGSIKINDLVEYEGQIYMVTSINEERFSSWGGWARPMTLESLGGGGLFDVPEEKVTLIATDAKLRSMRKKISDFPDPRERLFGP